MSETAARVDVNGGALQVGVISEDLEPANAEREGQALPQRLQVAHPRGHKKFATMEIKEHTRGSSQSRIVQASRVSQGTDDEAGARPISPNRQDSRSQKADDKPEDKEDFRAYYDMKAEEIQKITEHSMSAHSSAHQDNQMGYSGPQKTRQSKGASEDRSSSRQVPAIPALGGQSPS